mgnify:CR=1 FL=1
MAESEVATLPKNSGGRPVSARDVHIAKVIQDDYNEYVADKPVKLARTIKIKASDKVSIEKIYSDDGVEDIVSNYEGSELELELNTLSPYERSMLFGMLYKDGYLIHSKNDVPPQLALGYRSKRLGGKYRFVWYYVGVFGEGLEETLETMEDKLKTQTVTIKGTFYERKKDDRYKNEVDEAFLLAENVSAAEAIKNWFGEVQEYKENVTIEG